MTCQLCNGVKVRGGKEQLREKAEGKQCAKDKKSASYVYEGGK